MCCSMWRRSGLRQAVAPLAGRDDRGRARRGCALQEKPDGFRAVETVRRRRMPGWDSPWGRGRPGWHIECSAMSEALSGRNLRHSWRRHRPVFPHHENEIAQSEGAHHGHPLAQRLDAQRLPAGRRREDVQERSAISSPSAICWPTGRARCCASTCCAPIIASRSTGPSRA